MGFPEICRRLLLSKAEIIGRDLATASVLNIGSCPSPGGDM